MCATHNVTKSTKTIVQRELKRGGNITDGIMYRNGQWKDLFVKHTFFTESYKYYLSIVSASTTKEAQLIWSGFVESKVRFMVGSLEEHESISIAHPFNKGFERSHKCSTEEEIQKAKGGSLEFQVKDVPTETTNPIKGSDIKPGTITKEEVGNGISKDEGKIKVENSEGDKKDLMVYTTTFYIGLELRDGKCSPP